MTLDEKRSRRRERMRRKILDAAMQLFARKGFENVSLRGIAKKIDYSPAAIYRYFKDKDEILGALRREGFAMFVEKQKEHLGQPDSLTRLRASGRAYLAFAHEHPEYFHLMFNLVVHSKECQGDWTDKPMESFEILQGMVRDCIADGHFSGVSPDAVVFGLWAATHGLANLLISGRIAALVGEERLDELLEDIAAFTVRSCPAGDAAKARELEES